MDLKKLENIDFEIKKFKSKIFKKYNVDLVVFSYKKNELKKVNVQLVDLWSIYIDHIKDNYPEYFQYTDFRNATRQSTWVALNQSFSYIAYTELSYSYSEIGRFVNKEHSTIIHQVKKAGGYIDKKDPLFCNIHKLMFKKYKEYVGTIYKNSKI